MSVSAGQQLAPKHFKVLLAFPICFAAMMQHERSSVIRELKMRRRNEKTTTTGSWICTDARAAHVSVCVFVVHGSSTTKFARESGSRENVSNTFFLEALFRRFQLIFRCCVPGRVLYVE